MLTAEELLQIEKIKYFLEEYPDAFNEVNAAATKLADKEDAEKALIKSLPALKDKKINVFFS